VKPLRAPNDVEATVRLVLSPAYGEPGCELLVFGSGKRGAFHLRGSHARIPASDLRNVPLRRGDWRALVDHIEAKRLWTFDPMDLQSATSMDAVLHLFEAQGSALHPFRVPFGSAPASRLGRAVEHVIGACARAAAVKGCCRDGDAIDDRGAR
jgi:hypothetical protein